MRTLILAHSCSGFTWPAETARRCHKIVSDALWPSDNVATAAEIAADTSSGTECPALTWEVVLLITAVRALIAAI